MINRQILGAIFSDTLWQSNLILTGSEWKAVVDGLMPVYTGMREDRR